MYDRVFLRIFLLLTNESIAYYVYWMKLLFAQCHKVMFFTLSVCVFTSHTNCLKYAFLGADIFVAVIFQFPKHIVHGEITNLTIMEKQTFNIWEKKNVLYVQYIFLGTNGKNDNQCKSVRDNAKQIGREIPNKFQYQSKILICIWCVGTLNDNKPFCQWLW